MKKIVLLALVLITITATAFSRNSDAVNQKILSSFHKEYSQASDVKWEIKKDFTRATFTIDGQTMYAYYRQDGQRIAVTRNVSVTQLPISLSTSLKAKMSDRWLANLFEVSANGQTEYYATVNSATHTIVYQSDGIYDWVIFKKQKL